MKTSLVIDNYLFKEAQKSALQDQKTVSEVLSHWARVGLEMLRQKKNKKKSFSLKTVNLGKPAVDINSRHEWMDALDDRD